MCFSAAANFIGGGVLAGFGAASLSRVRRPNELLFAALPLLFAVHQVIEGVVWLGLDGIVSKPILDGAAAAFMLYAQGLLPILVPLSILLIEPCPVRRRRIWPFVALGVALGVYILWALAAFDTSVFVRQHSIVYENPGTEYTGLAALYVLTVCGAMFFSGYRSIIALGVANLLGVLIVMVIKRYAFTSVWCAYAAVVSVLIFWHVHRQRQVEPAQARY